MLSPLAISQSQELPDLSLDLLLKLSGTNNNFQPLLLVERRGLCLFLEPPVLSLDLLLKLNGTPNSFQLLLLLMLSPLAISQSQELPDLSLDLLLKLSGTNNNFQPLLLVGRRGLSLFPEPFPDLFLDLLLKPNGTNRTWPPSLILPPLDPFPSLEPPV